MLCLRVVDTETPMPTLPSANLELDPEEQLRRDGLVAWAEYQATGQHVTGDEADTWLSRLEAGEDLEPPSPHS
jgi:hypothetical protein